MIIKNKMIKIKNIMFPTFKKNIALSLIQFPKLLLLGL